MPDAGDYSSGCRRSTARVGVPPCATAWEDEQTIRRMGVVVAATRAGLARCSAGSRQATYAHYPQGTPIRADNRGETILFGGFLTLAQLLSRYLFPLSSPNLHHLFIVELAERGYIADGANRGMGRCGLRYSNR